jgi:hypothetical protein
MRVFFRFMGAAGVVGVWLAAGAVLAGEPLQINQWRVCAVPDGDFQKRTIPSGAEWFWVGHPADSFHQEKIFAHKGPVAYYVHFRLDPFPENVQPLLLINGLPEGSVVLQGGKPLGQANQRQKGLDAFSVERWYRLGPGFLHSGPGDNMRLEIWAPCIRRTPDKAVAPVSVIVLEEPDVLAERERQKKLQQPYLHEVGDTEDPYVARHW